MLRLCRAPALASRLTQPGSQRAIAPLALVRRAIDLCPLHAAPARHFAAAVPTTAPPTADADEETLDTAGDALAEAIAAQLYADVRAEVQNDSHVTEVVADPVLPSAAASAEAAEAPATPDTTEATIDATTEASTDAPIDASTEVETTAEATPEITEATPTETPTVSETIVPPADESSAADVLAAAVPTTAEAVAPTEPETAPVMEPTPAKKKRAPRGTAAAAKDQSEKAPPKEKKMKAPKPPKEPKQPKEAKQPKPPKELKVKAPKEPKPPKEEKPKKVKKLTKKVQKRADELRAEIKRADDIYYGGSGADSGLKDAEYDVLYRELQELEYTYPSLRDAASPTSGPGMASVSADDSSVPHLLPMLSLQSCTSFDAVHKWDASVRRGLRLGEDAPPLQYNLELKYDGIAVSLLYTDGTLSSVRTRGSGLEGEDITVGVARWVRNVPQRLNLASLPADLAPFATGTVEVRGEILLTAPSHAAYTAHLRAAGATPEEDGSNTPPRNLTAGLLRRDPVLDEDTSAAPPPPLSLVAYSLHLHDARVRHVTNYLRQPEVGEESDESPIARPGSQSQALQLLADLGAPISPDGPVAAARAADVCQTAMGVEEAVSLLQSWTDDRRRDGLQFGIDGVVLKVDDLNLAASLGATSHHPKAALAFKFAAKTAETQLEQVEFKVGRDGRVVPVAHLKPVTIDGVVVARASLHNCAVLTDLELGIGDTVAVERRGDVIPYVARCVERATPPRPVSLPTTCPCPESSPLESRPAASDASRSDLFCVSPTCASQSSSRIEHYGSKRALDIEGLGRSTVAELRTHGLVTSLQDIVLLPTRRHEMIDAAAEGRMKGWGETRIDKLCANVTRAHARATHAQLLVAVGVPRLGASQAKALLHRFGTLEAVLDARPDDMIGLPGCGPKLVPTFLAAFAVLKSTIVPVWRSQGVNLGASDTDTADEDSEKQ